MDLTTHDTDGRAWDFNSIAVGNRAIRRVLEDRSLFSLGGSMCTVYNSMSYINHARVSPEEVEPRFKHAREHSEFNAKPYEIQLDAGRHFLHERPHAASSWYGPCIQDMVKRHGVLKAIGGQCVHGPRSKNKDNEGPTRRRTRFMTNSIRVAQQLEKRCPNNTGHTIHQHIRLESGRIKEAQLYPR